MLSGVGLMDRRTLPVDLGQVLVTSCPCKSHSVGQPRRLRRLRSKGWKLPEDARYCGRGTLFSNPFAGRRFGHLKSVQLHRRWLHGYCGALYLERIGFHPREIDALVRLRARVLANLHHLAGKDLACWCPLNAPCHVDNLIEYAPLYAGADRLAS